MFFKVLLLFSIGFSVFVGISFAIKNPISLGMYGRIISGIISGYVAFGLLCFPLSIIQQETKKR